MKIAITGASGLVGTELTRTLRARGDDVVRVGRGRAEAPDAVRWDPEAGELDPAAFDGLDAVVHLAGAGIGDKRWSAERKREILESRTQGTGLVARTLAGLAAPPPVLLSASAVGYYGARGDEILTEESAPGDDFVAEVCIRWEAATAPAADAGIRVVHLRSAPILARRGGLLPRLVLPFKLGLGGRVGSGRQPMSWISLPDEVAAILHLLEADLSGPVNLCAPEPVTNAEFTETLGAVLHRPTLLPTPLLPLKLRYGPELVQTLLLDGQRALPRRLEGSGFVFAHPTLERALRAVLGRERGPGDGEATGTLGGSGSRP